MRTVVPVLFLAASLFAADADLNGRWTIQPQEARSRAWWLEVEGAGTPNLRGRFVGFPGGGMDQIQRLELKNGELFFTYDRVPRGSKENERIYQEYRVRLDGKDRLKGSFKSKRENLPLVGWRAAVIKDKDDGTWREGKPVNLFNGKDLSNWLPLIPGRELGWSVKNGSMTNVAKANNVISKEKFWNFKAHVEYRLSKGSNSGIGLRGRYEVQILDDYGRDAGTHGNGALYSRIIPSSNVTKAPGEWQTFDITLIGRDVTVVLNGTTIIDKKEIEGLTAIATDPHEAEPGGFIIQGDHGPVEIRKFVVTPLLKK
jgi:hypothetical protein